jgi:hypothetical protein
LGQVITDDTELYGFEPSRLLNRFRDLANTVGRCFGDRQNGCRLPGFVDLLLLVGFGSFDDLLFFAFGAVDRRVSLSFGGENERALSALRRSYNGTAASPEDLHQSPAVSKSLRQIED